MERGAETFEKEAAKGCLYVILIALVIGAVMFGGRYSNISQLDNQDKMEQGR